MLPVRLVLASVDEDYIEPFLHYIRCSEYERKLMVTAFSRRDALWKYIENSPDAVDAVLGEASFQEGGQGKLREGIPWIELREGVQSANATGSGPGVAKYQALNRLITDVLDIVRGRREVVLSGNGTKVIGIISAAGGSGKTTVSMHLARQLASEGKQVFYMSLEWLQSEILYSGSTLAEDDNNPGLARLLYDLKAAEERQRSLQQPVSTYVRRNSFLLGDTFPPLNNLNEVIEMNRGDVEKLIDYIAGNGSYDVLIIDTDYNSGERIEAVLSRSDQLLWIVTEDMAVIRKTDRWLTYLERTLPGQYSGILGKSHFLANRATGDGCFNFPGRAISIAASLSWIPAWNNGAGETDGRRHAPAYQRDMMQLSRLLQDSWRRERTA